MPILGRLYNLERLSLNSNAMWQLHPDTFNFNTKLSSISLHNNAITCLDGVFDNLIDKVGSSKKRHFTDTFISENPQARSSHTKLETHNWMVVRVPVPWRRRNARLQGTHWCQPLSWIKKTIQLISHLETIRWSWESDIMILKHIPFCKHLYTQINWVLYFYKSNDF